MLPRICFFLTMGFALVANAGNLDTLVLAGSKEQVLATLRTAMDEEFPDGSRSPLPDRIGFQVQFKSFWTGNTLVKAALSPLADNDSLEPTAYGIQIADLVQRGSATLHVTSLFEAIRKAASQNASVKVVNASDYRTLMEQGTRCLNTLEDDPDLQLLKGKVALTNLNNQTFEMLANDTFPTKEERKAILLWATKVGTCSKAPKANFSFWPNNPLNLWFSTMLNSSEELKLALYKGQLTYGNFAKIRKEQNDKFTEWRLKVVEEMKAKDAAAQERVQQLGMEQQRLLIEQQKANAALYKPTIPIPKQTTTSCNFVGNHIECSSF